MSSGKMFHRRNLSQEKFFPLSFCFYNELAPTYFFEYDKMENKTLQWQCNRLFTMFRYGTVLYMADKCAM